ncbi:MAG TPA: glycosyltransferase family 2 protein [Chthonomonadaceae bacterium]|nr:glycosyltransferase family 2 protein [Chthonomonadaceae bacterium]
MTAAMWMFGIAWALIVYTYVGFPLVLAAIARFLGRTSGPAPSHTNAADRLTEPPDCPAALPSVAMVVAAFNEEAVLAAKLANTWAIDYPSDRFELWVGSDGSTDNTDTILSVCRDARLRFTPFAARRGKISVLNDLMAQVDADIVVMSDANTSYAPDAVHKLVAHFADSRVGCVSGELRLLQNGGVSGEGLYWRYENWIKRMESRLGFLIGCNGGIFAIRRGCYEPLPPSTIVEDFVMTMRILERGYRVVLAPEARAFEPACGSARAEMVRKVRIGAGGFQALGLTRRLLLPGFGLRAFAFWGHKVLRWLVPFFWLAALAANAALSVLPAFRLFLLLQAAGVAVAALAYGLPERIQLPRWTRPISYFYLMNWSLFFGFVRFVTRTQRVTWDRVAPTPAPAAASSEIAA